MCVCVSNIIENTHWIFDKIEDKKLNKYLKSKNGDFTLNLTSPLQGWGHDTMSPSPGPPKG